MTSGAVAAATPRRILPDLGGVEETMLITLWARAEETLRRDGLLTDHVAVALRESLDYDFDRFQGAWKSQVGVAVRTRFMDEATRRFLAAHPDAVVVNLGAGLDTRGARLDNGRRHWIDVDTVEASRLRRQLLPPAPRTRLLAASALDSAWIDAALEAAGDEPSRRVLVLAEGVLMFLPRPGVEAMVREAVARLPGGEMVFDVIGGMMVRFPWLHDSLTRVGPRFAWGLGPGEQPNTWSPRPVRVESRSMLDEAPGRWRWMRALRRVPAFRRQFMVTRLVFGV